MAVKMPLPSAFARGRRKRPRSLRYRYRVDCKQFSVRLPLPLYQKLNEEAEKGHREINSMLTKLLAERYGIDIDSLLFGRRPE